MTAYHFLLIVVVVLCFLLIMLILSQNPKGGGLSGAFGGGGSQMFGVQRTNDFLDKSTWILASCIALIIIISTVLIPSKEPVLDTDTPVNTENTQGVPANNDAGTTAPVGENTTPATGE